MGVKTRRIGWIPFAAEDVHLEANDHAAIWPERSPADSASSTARARAWIDVEAGRQATKKATVAIHVSMARRSAAGGAGRNRDLLVCRQGERFVLSCGAARFDVGGVQIAVLAIQRAVEPVAQFRQHIDRCLVWQGAQDGVSTPGPVRRLRTVRRLDNPSPQQLGAQLCQQQAAHPCKRFTAQARQRLRAGP
jgi:hypothetical protein